MVSTVRRRYINALADQITSPFASDWMPASLKQYDSITRDEYLRSEGISEAALRMMNLGSTPVARFRSFLDVLHEVAVNRELRRRSAESVESSTMRRARACSSVAAARTSRPAPAMWCAPSRSRRCAASSFHRLSHLPNVLRSTACRTTL
jgi:hypothetical protein